MSGLEEVGIAGGDYLREALTNCTDPLAAIEEFQVENGILLPTLQPALPLLDLHEIHRYEFHQSVLEQLRDKLLERINELSKQEEKNSMAKIEELLEKSFPLIRIAAVRPVVMTLMKYMPEVPEKYLQVLVEDRELYEEAAVEVKRQIWQDNQSLFGDEVSPLLSEYIKLKEKQLFGVEAGVQYFYASPPKLRRQGSVVVKLTEMVGKNIKLYDMVLQFLRTLFLRTRNIHYCTLRAELLMSLHDLEVHEICSIDPCHKFTWCLDACIRERFVDEKRSRELQGFLNGVKKGQEQVLGDLSMILCDPFAIHTLATSSIKILNQLASTESLPRDSSELILLLRMLTLGLGAWTMINSQTFRESKLDNDLILKYLPCVLGFIVDDHTQAIRKRLGESENLKSLLPDTYLKYLKKDHVAFTLAIYYIMNVAKQKNRIAVSRLLPSLLKGESERSFEDTFLHPLLSSIALLCDEFSSEEFCNIVFDEFFIPASSVESVRRHSLRLLHFVFHRMSPKVLNRVMESLEPELEVTQCISSSMTNYA
ncbi:negative elongation factor B-like [Saccoglossus kowalevskii]|uniref:Negative elongation factor B-like n=1 Tax=Saccoglossus kowalevskii TaxID=10224 RepID=A0ABM0GQZ6_SACKO|nr:PREDICTED: negative elongation factor B-like [Saccoglossus kowalevskii]